MSEVQTAENTRSVDSGDDARYGEKIRLRVG
jgi:hypothetical protein